MLKLMRMTFFYAAVAVGAATCTGAAVAAATNSQPAMKPASNCDQYQHMTEHGAFYCNTIRLAYPKMNSASACSCVNGNPIASSPS